MLRCVLLQDSSLSFLPLTRIPTQARGGVERLQRTLREEREAFAFQLGALNAAAAKERAEWQAKLLLERGETLAARASAQKDIAAATKAAAEAAHKERAAQMKALAVAAEVHRAEVSKLAGELAEERRSGSGPVASQRARLESLRLSAASSLRAAASASGQGRAGAASEEVAALREQLRAEKAARVAAEERLLALFKAQSG